MRRWLWLVCLVLVSDALIGGRSYAVVTPIRDLKTIDANGNALNTGKTFTVTGVVTVASGTLNKTDLDIYIQDATAGINISKRSAGYFKVKLGDSLLVTGVVDQGGTTPTRGNTKITVTDLADIVILGKGSVPVARTVTGADLAKDAAPPLEAYEGMLVRLEGVTLNAADWPASGTDRTITAQDPSGSVKFRVDRDTDIDGSALPRQPFVLSGVVIQDDASSPWLAGYTVWPRARYGDFLAMGDGSGIATLEPSVVETTAESFDLAVTIAGNLADTIDLFQIELPVLDGWEWDGDVDLAGPGLADADYILIKKGVAVSGAAIYDDRASYGVVTFRNMRPPASEMVSAVVVKTRAGGADMAEIAVQPTLACVRPKPAVVISEVFPNDGVVSASDAFIELHNSGSSMAHLEGFVLTEARAVPYCDPEVRYVFTAADTITPGGYLVLAESAQGFAQRFPGEKSITAAIRPLGRVTGDGAISDNVQAYEAISIWRDATMTDLVDYLEYRDRVTCPADLCTDLGREDDGFPYVPPKRYAIVGRNWRPCCPFDALSSDPTPGEANRRAYLAPAVERVNSFGQSALEVVFSEPLGAGSLASKSSFVLAGGEALAMYPSTNGDKALLLFPKQSAGTPVTLEVTGLASWAGVALSDTACAVPISSGVSNEVCEVQAYDRKGYSLLEGANVSIYGFITVPPLVFQPSYQSIYVQGLDGCGVNVFSYDVSSPLPRLGDFVYLGGLVEEYVSSSAGSTTEIFMSAPTSLSIVSRGYPEPAPAVLATGEVGLEDNEGKLVETQGAVVAASDYSFYLDDGSGGIQIYQNYTPIDFTQFATGMYVKVKGVVLQYDYSLPFLESYELVPRYQSDIEIIAAAFAPKAVLDVEPRVFCPSCGEESFPVKFNAPALSDVALRIFDGTGRLVATLYSGASIGERLVAWTGRDQTGKPFPPGLYVCHFQAVESGSGTKTTDSAPIVIGTELK